jgi:hypothetical protein
LVNNDDVRRTDSHPMNPRIHYPKPSITELEVAYATDAARNGWGERGSEYINCRLGITP